VNRGINDSNGSYGIIWDFLPLDGDYIDLDGKVNEIMKQGGKKNPHIPRAFNFVLYYEITWNFKALCRENPLNKP
jgi:hypothetical protein